MSVNRGLIALYWDIGRTIVAAQKDKGYGKQVVERLASDLRREFPDMAGFSPQNVWFMRGFYLAWAEGEEVQKLQRPVGVSPILLQAVRELPERGKCTAIPAESEPNLSQHVRESTEKKLSQPVTESMTVPPEPIASLPWGHNRLLLTKLDTPPDRLWYARKAVEHGWSRAVLTHHIEAQLHTREGKAVTNFSRTLPPLQSDLAAQTLTHGRIHQSHNAWLSAPTKKEPLWSTRLVPSARPSKLNRSRRVARFDIRRLLA